MLRKEAGIFFIKENVTKAGPERFGFLLETGSGAKVAMVYSKRRLEKTSKICYINAIIVNKI